MAGLPATEFHDALTPALANLRLTLTLPQQALLWGFYLRVIEVNRRVNLTRITEPADFAVRHVADALAIERWLAEQRINPRRILDVGTGAGVPAIPLAVVDPERDIWALDGTAKKVRILAEIARELGLTNLHAAHARAEHWRPDEPFDLVLFKAVGPLARCLATGRPLLAANGHLAIYKTEKLPTDETIAAETLRRKLRLAPPTLFRYALPLGDQTLARALWIFSRGRS